MKPECRNVKFILREPEVGQTPTPSPAELLQQDQTATDFQFGPGDLNWKTTTRSRTMKQVLIVDDSEQIRERLAAMLAESTRIRIVGQAGDGHEALNAMERLRPDTVILDIRLPGSSGIDVLKQIKARYPQMQVIMLTNYDQAMYRRQCRLLGADHFLNKTLEFDKIVAAIMGEPTR
jgi:CheY-like chemotaxis protein